MDKVPSHNKFKFPVLSVTTINERQRALHVVKMKIRNTNRAFVVWCYYMFAVQESVNQTSSAVHASFNCGNVMDSPRELPGPGVNCTRWFGRTRFKNSLKLWRWSFQRTFWHISCLTSRDFTRNLKVKEKVTRANTHKRQTGRCNCSSGAASKATLDTCFCLFCNKIYHIEMLVKLI